MIKDKLTAEVPCGQLLRRATPLRTAATVSDNRGLVSLREAPHWSTGEELCCAHHARLLFISALSEPKGEVADGLSARLDLDRLVVGKRVVLRAGE